MSDIGQADDDGSDIWDAVMSMSQEEVEAELREAGVDIALFTKQTKALVKACVERNEAQARIRELEAEVAEMRGPQIGLKRYMGSYPRDCTPEERAVLDAMAKIPEHTILEWQRRSFTTVLPLADAELARRSKVGG